MSHLETVDMSVMMPVEPSFPTIYRHYGSDVFHPEYLSRPLNSNHIKPSRGLWASPFASNHNWYQFCTEEHFQEESLDIYFDFMLKSDAKILRIETVKDLFDTVHKYTGQAMSKLERQIYVPYESEKYLYVYPDWAYISAIYDGVEVKIGDRWSDFYFYLYGWDVDTLVVWNPEVVRVI